MKSQRIEIQGIRSVTEYYETGSLFKTHYTHYRKNKNEGLDSMATMVYHENGHKLYEHISSSIGLPKDLGSFWTEKAWDDSGNIEYEKGNGMVSTYELKDGKLFVQKRELKLDSSLFLAFTPLLHWEDSIRAFVDDITKDYIKTHPWAGYPSSAETCLSSLTTSTQSRLDSFQKAVLHPVFEVICSIYHPWHEADSLVLTNLLKTPATQKDPHESLKKELIFNWYYGFPFGTETLHSIYLLQNDKSLQRQSWYYLDKEGGEDKKLARSRWDVLVFELQFLKQRASPEEMIVWMARNLTHLTYLYKDPWAYDTVFPTQTRALLATQDSMERFWLPKLKKLQKKVWKKLTEEERSQIIALRKTYQEVIQNNRKETQLMRYRLHRNQTPNRNDYTETLYDFIETSYPNFRYLQLLVHRPAGLVRGELEALSDHIYAGLGKQKDDLQKIEKQIFAALKPCVSIWSSAFAWYWKGKDEERLRALNFMLID